MAGVGEIWTLRQRGDVVGTIHVEKVDMPWAFGTWDPAPGFQAVEDLFAEELRLFHEENWPAWERAHSRIVAAAVTLDDAHGLPVDGFIVHVDRDQAWFRWDGPSPG